MNTYDFARSFLRWTSTRVNHSPRLQIDAACTLATGGDRREFFLSAMCTGETMYAPSNLIHHPPNEFAMVCEPNRAYMPFKFFADESLNTQEVLRIGEAMATKDGRGATVLEMPVFMAHWKRARPLTTYRDVREAILGNVCLNARTEFTSPDGKTQVVMDYPVKICNVSHAVEMWQIDTGCVLLPDFAAPASEPIALFRRGYIVFNSWDWAEVIFQRGKAGPGPTPKSHFSESRRIEAKNSLYAVE